MNQRVSGAFGCFSAIAIGYVVVAPAEGDQNGVEEYLAGPMSNPEHPYKEDKEAYELACILVVDAHERHDVGQRIVHQIRR